MRPFKGKLALVHFTYVSAEVDTNISQHVCNQDCHMVLGAQYKFESQHAALQRSCDSHMQGVMTGEHHDYTTLTSCGHIRVVKYSRASLLPTETCATRRGES